MMQGPMAPQAPQQQAYGGGINPAGGQGMGGQGGGQGFPEMPPNAYPPPEQEPPEPADEGQDIMSIIDEAISNKNLAEKMDDEDLTEVAKITLEGYERDLQSCQGWLDNASKWLELALLIRKNKMWPWPNSSNVKFPLLATAAMQFSARAYPALVPADGQIVKARIIGPDHDGSRTDRAERISQHMSYQIMCEIDGWEEDMDRLLNIGAIAGTVFKKTYRDGTTQKIVSKIVYPENLIINYWAKSIEDAYRKTEILYITKNEYESKIRAGEFLDIGDIGQAENESLQSIPEQTKTHANENHIPEAADDATPHIFLAQHTFYDLDEDGYAEPVVIYIHLKTQKVVRIIARFHMDGIKMDEDGKKVIRIEPLEYFTAFSFLPNPDGSLYGLGFGSLLGPINETINSLINQLVDSGTLNNLQSGFVAKGLRIQMKETQFLPGEWKAVNATGDDLQKSIFPIPTKEPSNVLFQLMNLLIQSGNQLASVADIMVGKMPGQNTPAGTTQEAVNQSMAVFTAIYKRFYRSLGKELCKIYNLNRLNPQMAQEEAEILGVQITSSDYEGSYHDIIPSADPSGDALSQKMQKIQQVGQLLQYGTINIMEFTQRVLDANEVPNPEKLIQQPPPPPPDPKMAAVQAKIQGDQQMAGIKMQLEQKKADLMAQKGQIEMQLKQMEMDMKGKEMHMDMQFKQMDHQLDQQIAQTDAALHVQVAERQAQTDQAMMAQEAQHTTTMHKQEEGHTSKMNELKQKMTVSRDAQGNKTASVKGKNGKTTSATLVKGKDGKKRVGIKKS